MAGKDYSRFAKNRNDGNAKTRSLSELNNGMYNIKAPYRSNNNEVRLADVEVNRLINFQGETPFEDYIGTEKFETLVRDIEENGIQTRVILREREDGRYEILAGRHRCAAARYLRFATVPAEVYPSDTTDTKAMLLHLSTNLLQGRSKLSFLETVRAMVAYEATLNNLKGKRSDRQENGEKYDRYQQLAEVFGIGNKTTAVQYLKAGKEMPEDILQFIDRDAVPFSVAYKILQQSDEAFKTELYGYIRQGNKLTMPMLDELISAYKEKKNGIPENVVEPEIKKQNEPITDDVKIEEKKEVAVEGLNVAEESEANEKPEAKLTPKEEPVLKTDDFEKIIGAGKKKKTYTLKVDKEKLPERFLDMDDVKKESLIVDLLKQWNESF